MSALTVKRRSSKRAFSPSSRLHTESGVKLGCEDTETAPTPQLYALGLTASTAGVGSGMGRLKPPGREPLAIVPYKVRSGVGVEERFSLGSTVSPSQLTT